MAEFRLDIELLSHGWATVRLTLPNWEIEFVASYTPRDSISDLANATAGLISGIDRHVVIWNTEPMKFEFRIVTEDARTQFEVYQYSDSRQRMPDDDSPIAVFIGDRAIIARSLWRGLRRLQGSVSLEEFATSWRHQFPVETVERIGDLFGRRIELRK